MVAEGIGMNITLYLEAAPNGLTLFLNASNDRPQLFNGNDKINRQVLEDKKQEIFGQRQLPAGQAVSNIPTLEECLANWRSNVYRPN